MIHCDVIPIVIDTSYPVPTFLGSSAQNLLPCVLLSDMFRFSRGNTMQISPFLEMVQGDRKAKDVERCKVVWITVA